jgi:hypothetical protein
MTWLRPQPGARELATHNTPTSRPRRCAAAGPISSAPILPFFPSCGPVETCEGVLPPAGAEPADLGAGEEEGGEEGFSRRPACRGWMDALCVRAPRCRGGQQDVSGNEKLMPKAAMAVGSAEGDGAQSSARQDNFTPPALLTAANGWGQVVEGCAVSTATRPEWRLGLGWCRPLAGCKRTQLLQQRLPDWHPPWHLQGPRPSHSKLSQRRAETLALLPLPQRAAMMLNLKI